MDFKKRLAGKTAPKSFENWTDWQDITGHMSYPNGGVPPRGLKRVVGNNQFVVQIYEKDSRWGDLTQLVITRIDGNEIRDNEVLLRIKDELTSPDLEAVEHLPASTKKIPLTNQLRVVWVMPPGFFLPFNYGDKLV